MKTSKVAFALSLGSLGGAFLGDIFADSTLIEYAKVLTLVIVSQIWFVASMILYELEKQMNRKV